MEANLNCNVKQCGVQLSNQAVVTACSRHGFTGSGPYTCPVCRQPLIGGEIYKQVLQPSDEWKSVALCGLNPIVIMECAGRAVSFWSYQMTNQIMFQLQKNKDLQQQCLNLEGEVENMWNQGNARISSLTAKMKDMELREQGLIRKCEDLRLNLADKASELCRSQELYNKLKQRVLLEQSPISAGVRPSKPAPTAPSPNFGNKRTHSLAYAHQTNAPVIGMPGSTQVTDYFPESPSYSKIQANQANLGVVGWNNPAHGTWTTIQTEEAR
ncbi:hypothetical protein QBC39DRAFT_296795 [Podospora conica]|nr:hypothetical protein QBC39DRAFT_296795 [Schizothecium conicum]